MPAYIAESQVLIKEGVSYELTMSFKKAKVLSTGRSFDYTAFAKDAIEFIPYDDVGGNLLEDKKMPLFLQEFTTFDGITFAKIGTKKALTPTQKENLRKASFYVKQVFLNPHRKAEECPQFNWVKPEPEKQMINYSLPLINYLVRIGDNRQDGIGRDGEIASLKEDVVNNKHTDIYNSLMDADIAARNWQHSLCLFNGAPVCGAKGYTNPKLIEEGWITEENEGKTHSANIPTSTYNLDGAFPAGFEESFLKMYSLINYVTLPLGISEIQKKIGNIASIRLPDLNKVEGIQDGFLVKLNPLNLDKREQNLLAHYLATYEENVEAAFTLEYSKISAEVIPVVTSRTKLKKLQRQYEEKKQILEYALVIDLVQDLDKDEHKGDVNEYLDSFIKGVYIFVNKKMYNPLKHLVKEDGGGGTATISVALIIKDPSCKDALTKGFFHDPYEGISLYSMEVQSPPKTLAEVTEDNSKDNPFYWLYSVTGAGKITNKRQGLFQYSYLEPHYRLEPKFKSDTGDYNVNLWLPITLMFDEEKSQATVWIKLGLFYGKENGGSFKYSVSFPTDKGWRENRFFVTHNTTKYDNSVIRDLFIQNGLFKEFGEELIADAPESLTKTVVSSMEIYEGFVRDTYLGYVGGVSSGGGGGGSSAHTYQIKDVNEGYSTVEADFNGNTVLLVNVTSASGNITLTKPADSFVGKSITIMLKTAKILNIQPSGDVSILPTASATLKKEGASTTFVYKGNGVFLGFGELP